MKSRDGKQCVNSNCPFKLRKDCVRFENATLVGKVSYTPESNPDGSYFCKAFDKRES